MSKTGYLIWEGPRDLYVLDSRGCKEGVGHEVNDE